MALGIDDTIPLQPPSTTTAGNKSKRATAPPLSPIQHQHSPVLPIEGINSLDYVTFIINATDTIIANRNAIIEHSIELSRIINETRPINGCFPITGISCEDFESLIKFCENKFIKIDGVDDALRKLETAKRFVCPCLIRRCVRDIDHKLTVANIIKVFRLLRYYVVAITPSKQISIEKKSPDECLESLMYNVFQFIDINADVVLQRDEMLDLSFSEIEVILRREHLLMSSEMVIFNLITNWSRLECQRRNLELSAENRRRVLGSLCYIPRYLQMTIKEFDLLCQRSDILDPEEVNLIQGAFKAKHLDLSVEQLEMLTNFKRARPKYARMPIHLSNRSHPKNYTRKMRSYEQSFSEDGSNSWILWFCGCYAFLCD